MTGFSHETRPLPASGGPSRDVASLAKARNLPSVHDLCCRGGAAGCTGPRRAGRTDNRTDRSVAPKKTRPPLCSSCSGPPVQTMGTCFSRRVFALPTGGVPSRRSPLSTRWRGPLVVAVRFGSLGRVPAARARARRTKDTAAAYGDEIVEMLGRVAAAAAGIGARALIGEQARLPTQVSLSSQAECFPCARTREARALEAVRMCLEPVPSAPERLRSLVAPCGTRRDEWLAQANSKRGSQEK